MKKLLMIAALMVASLSANAQGMYAKPMAGAVLTNLVGDVSDTKMLFGAVGGMEIGGNITKMFALTGGLLFTMQGCKDYPTDTYFNTPTTLHLNYLSIPLLANVYVLPGLAIKAGPQVGLLVKAKRGDANYMDFCQKFDFSVPVGLSYEINDVVIDARYNIGVTKVNKDDIHGFGFKDPMRNSLIMLTVGYKVPM